MSSDGFTRFLTNSGGRRATRRGLLKGTAAAGLSAAALGLPRVVVPARAQDGELVTFWTTFTPPDLDIMKTMVETFNAQSGGTQVELVQIPPAEVTDVAKLMTAVRGGTGPDVYHLDRFTTAQRAADGVLQDLSELGGADLLSPYLPFARQEATYQGKPYAMPLDADARALWYNKGMLQEAGIDPAEFDPANGPLTWDRVAEVANQINVQEGGNFTKMGFVPWLNQGWHYTYGFAWGGQFFDQEACQVTPDDPRIVAAFEWVQSYCEGLGAQQVSSFGSPTMAPGFPPQEHPFITGNLAMQITGDWGINQMEQYAPEIDYGTTFIPVPNAGDPSATWAGGWSLAIPQGAKRAEQAFEFMQWYAGDPGQRIYTQESKHLPTLEALLEVPELYTDRHRFFSEQLLPLAKNRPPLPVGALYWDELTVAWQKTYLGEEEPTAALATVKERVQERLQGDCPIAIEA